MKDKCRSLSYLAYRIVAGAATHDNMKRIVPSSNPRGAWLGRQNVEPQRLTVSPEVLRIKTMTVGSIVEDESFLAT